jgi:hypothetical protein
MMFQGRIVSMALLLVGAAPFGAAQDICTSNNGVFTVKVDLFASELGTFLRINQSSFFDQPHFLQEPHSNVFFCC